METRRHEASQFKGDRRARAKKRELRRNMTDAIQIMDETYARVRKIALVLRATVN